MLSHVGLHHFAEGGANVVVKAACLESRKSRIRTQIRHSSINEINKKFPYSLIKIYYCARDVACLFGKSVIEGSRPTLAFKLKKIRCVFLDHLQRFSIVRSPRDREVALAYSVSNRQGTNFELCVWRAVSSLNKFISPSSFIHITNDIYSYHVAVTLIFKNMGFRLQTDPSHYPLLAQISMCVHICGIKLHSLSIHVFIAKFKPQLVTVSNQYAAPAIRTWCDSGSKIYLLKKQVQS